MATKLVNLKDNDDILIPKVLPTIDMSNVIAEVYDSNGYTATEDCYVLINIYSNWNSPAQVLIDDVWIGTLAYIGKGGSREVNYSMIPLKKGQNIKGNISNDYYGYSDAMSLYVYGLKY